MKDCINFVTFVTGIGIHNIVDILEKMTAKPSLETTVLEEVA